MEIPFINIPFMHTVIVQQITARELKQQSKKQDKKTPKEFKTMHERDVLGYCSNNFQEQSGNLFVNVAFAKAIATLIFPPLLILAISAGQDVAKNRTKS